MAVAKTTPATEAGAAGPWQHLEWHCRHEAGERERGNDSDRDAGRVERRTFEKYGLPDTGSLRAQGHANCDLTGSNSEACPRAGANRGGFMGGRTCRGTWPA